MTHKRVRLPNGMQRKFIDAAIKRGGGVNHVAQFLKCSPRTIRDWRREKFLASYEAIGKLSRKYSIPLPQNIKLEERFWYVTKGARRGGLVSYQKQGGVIGDPTIRMQKWHEWWDREGKTKMPSTFYPFPFARPEKSVELAEFIGIMMGDGGMTDRQLSITLHHIDDLDYSYFVVALIKKLFNITAAVYHLPKYSVNRIGISRSNLMKYLYSLGLPMGNKIKQGLDVPDWIKTDAGYMIACIRGLVDTDGSIFTHTYRVNGKQYFYKKLSFCSMSPSLIKTVRIFLQSHGFHVRVKQGKDIRIESVAGMKHYMQFIGSHNPKHLKRYDAMV